MQRFGADWKVQLIELKPENRTEGKTTAQLLQTEADRLLSAIPANQALIALDERGKDCTTVQLGQQVEQWAQQWGTLNIVMGSADGLSPIVKQRANGLLRLSSLTLPHGMVRVLLLEQLYRCWSMAHNHPYHRS